MVYTQLTQDADQADPRACEYQLECHNSMKFPKKRPLQVAMRAMMTVPIPVTVGTFEMRRKHLEVTPVTRMVALRRQNDDTCEDDESEGCHPCDC